MRSYQRHAITWSVTFIIITVTTLYLISNYLFIPLNNDTIFWILAMNFGLTVIMVGMIKKHLHLGWLFLILGFYIVVIAGGFLYGGIDYSGISMIDFNPYDKQRLYDMTDTTINFFVVLGIAGIIMMGFGILQFWNKLSMGWK